LQRFKPVWYPGGCSDGLSVCREISVRLKVCEPITLAPNAASGHRFAICREDPEFDLSGVRLFCEAASYQGILAACKLFTHVTFMLSIQSIVFIE
jgi:hypothetical protein